jgi:monoamine oxidase
MNKLLQLTLFFLYTSQILTRNLQTLYSAIVIGAGSSGIGASVALASKNVNHIILEARNRFGGRTYATTIAGVNVDLGASFVHNPEKNNSIHAYATNLGWGKTSANFNNA